MLLADIVAIVRDFAVTVVGVNVCATFAVD
jgi:hypothetical protein